MLGAPRSSMGMASSEVETRRVLILLSRTLRGGRVLVDGWYVACWDLMTTANRKNLMRQPFFIVKSSSPDDSDQQPGPGELPEIAPGSPPEAPQDNPQELPPPISPVVPSPAPTPPSP